MIAQNQTGVDAPMPGHNMARMEMSVSDSPSTKAYIAANDHMHSDMMVEFTGDADIHFMRGMIPLHQGAIGMANMSVVRSFGSVLVSD
ncbi:DUF305 domain-containing protein [Devosia limi]|nr:DUF305 domain-containing protein [Devosia limi]